MKKVFLPVVNKEDINTDIKEEPLKATTRLGRILPSKFRLQQVGDSRGRQYWGQSGQVSAWYLFCYQIPTWLGQSPSAERVRRIKRSQMHIAAGRYWRESWPLSTAYNKFLSKSSFAFCIKILDIFPVSTRDWSRATEISENHLMSPIMVEVKGKNLCYMEISSLKSLRSLGQPWSIWRDITRFLFNILCQDYHPAFCQTEPESSWHSIKIVKTKAWPREQFLLQMTTRKMLGGVISKKRHFVFELKLRLDSKPYFVFVIQAMLAWF